MRVRTYEKIMDDSEEQPHWKREYLADGELIGFGVDYEELSSGVGQYSCAIILLDDGSFHTCSIDLMEALPDPHYFDSEQLGQMNLFDR